MAQRIEITLDEIDACSSTVDDEFLALESIYPDCLTVLPSISTSSSNTANPRRITLELPIELASPLPLVVIPLSESSTSSSPTSLQPSPQVDISHLPPLLLIFLLPPAYPFHAPPTLLSLHSTYSWFSSSLIPQFHQVILRLWEEGHEYGEGVLWRITECVRTGEILHLLNLISDKPTTIRIPHASPHLLTPLLQSHTHLSSQSTFSSLTFTCSICFSAFKGSKCHRLSGCQHVFCKECLSGYWQLSIDEGDIEKIACPDVDCVKKKGKEGSLMVEEGELRRLVGDEGVKRWKWLKEKKEIEKDPTIVLCPIQICQAPVRPPPRLATGEDLGTGREFDEGWDRLRTCQSCSYSFCVHCRRTWHGPLTPCASSFLTILLTEYLSLPILSPRRKILETRIGKKQLEKYLKAKEEEDMNKRWLNEKTMACTGCGVQVEKNEGCNHMTCSRCKAEFCYRCGQTLSRLDPYKHFQTRGPCYYKLFDHQDQVEDNWVEFDAVEVDGEGETS